MRHKKLFTLLLAAVMSLGTAIMFVGCGENTEPPDGNDKENTVIEIPETPFTLNDVFKDRTLTSVTVPYAHLYENAENKVILKDSFVVDDAQTIETLFNYVGNTQLTLRETDLKFSERFDFSFNNTKYVSFFTNGTGVTGSLDTGEKLIYFDIRLPETINSFKSLVKDLKTNYNRQLVSEGIELLTEFNLEQIITGQPAQIDFGYVYSYKIDSEDKDEVSIINFMHAYVPITEQTEINRLYSFMSEQKWETCNVRGSLESYNCYFADGKYVSFSLSSGSLYGYFKLNNGSLLFRTQLNEEDNEFITEYCETLKLNNKENETNK